MFQLHALPRGSQHPNLLYKKVLHDMFEGLSLHQLSLETDTMLTATGIFILNIDIFLSILSYSMKHSIQKPAVTNHHLINQRDTYACSCVAVDLNFNS